MDKVCATIDAQGFPLKYSYRHDDRNDNFRIRELAFSNADFKYCLEIDPEINFSQLRETDKTTVTYLSKHFHGLGYLCTESALKNSEVIDIIRSYYGMLATKERPLFGVNNTQLEKILTFMDIPFLHISKDERFTPFSKCNNHNAGMAGSQKSKFKCAYKKTELLWLAINFDLDLNLVQ